MAAPNTFVSDVDAVCRPDLQFRDEELASMSVTAADVRGDEVALLVYTSDVSAGAVCWRGLGDVLPHVTSQWNGKFGPADLRMRDLGRRDLCLWFNKGHGRAPEGRNFAHAVAGRYGDEIASVVIEETVQGRVQATTVDGWFLAWWPGHEEGPTRFRIVGLDALGQPVTDLVGARDAQDENWPCSSDSPQ
jgi:hypothetical protein